MNKSIQNWDTPIGSIPHLTNAEIHFFGGHLRIDFEDLDTAEKWQLQIWDVIGYKFTRLFGMKRLGNTFEITESTWISALHCEPMLILGQLDGVRHYLIESMEGEIEVLTKQEPLIIKVGSPVNYPQSKD